MLEEPPAVRCVSAPIVLTEDDHPPPGGRYDGVRRALALELDMASKRELIEPKGDKRFIRRDEKGRIKESDDVGRSLTADRRTKAKAVAKPGQGDKGDRKR